VEITSNGGYDSDNSPPIPKIKNLKLAPNRPPFTKDAPYLTKPKRSLSLSKQYEEASTYQFYSPSGKIPELALEKQYQTNYREGGSVIRIDGFNRKERMRNL